MTVVPALDGPTGTDHRVLRLMIPLMLVLFRGLQGIGGGGLNSLVMAIIGDVVPARRRSRYQALLGIVATLAPIAGQTEVPEYSSLSRRSWRSGQSRRCSLDPARRAPANR